MVIGGPKPVVAVNFTSISLALGQAQLSGGLLNLPAVVVLDRADVTGNDDPSHHELLDFAPCLAPRRLTIFAPSSTEKIPGVLTTHYQCRRQ